MEQRQERDACRDISGLTFDTQPDFETQTEDYISKIKDAGAIHWFYVLTSDTTARSMTIWPDAKTAHQVLSMVRDDAAKENNQTISGVCEGIVQRILARGVGSSHERWRRETTPPA